MAAASKEEENPWGEAPLCVVAGLCVGICRLAQTPTVCGVVFYLPDSPLCVCVCVRVHAAGNACVVSHFNRMAVIFPNVFFSTWGERPAFSRHFPMCLNSLTSSLGVTQCTAITRCLNPLPGNITCSTAWFAYTCQDLLAHLPFHWGWWRICFSSGCRLIHFQSRLKILPILSQIVHSL